MLAGAGSSVEICIVCVGVAWESFLAKLAEEGFSLQDIAAITDADLDELLTDFGFTALEKGVITTEFKNQLANGVLSLAFYFSILLLGFEASPLECTNMHTRRV